MPGHPASAVVSNEIPSVRAVEARMRALTGDAPASLTPVARAARDHLAAGGRRLRARLALDAAAKLGLDGETGIAAAATAELLHNASLVHDDLQDGDATRRGAPAVWAAYGPDVAICTGDMLLSAAHAAAAPLVAVAGARVPAHIHAAVAETIHGQTADRRAADAPLTDAAAYARMARAKSGPLLALPVELALLAAGEDDAVPRAGTAGRAFALAYQVADDLADAEADGATGGANIVALLAGARGLSRAPARREAAAMARDALAEARAAAATLPRRSGAALIEAADTLAAQLEEDRAHAP